MLIATMRNQKRCTANYGNTHKIRNRNLCQPVFVWLDVDMLYTYQTGYGLSEIVLI